MLSNCGPGEDSWEFLGLQGNKPLTPKGNQSWIFIGRTDAEALILWPPDPKNPFIGKDLGKDWKQEEKGVTEDDMVGWHQWFIGHPFPSPGVLSNPGIEPRSPKLQGDSLSAEPQGKFAFETGLKNLSTASRQICVCVGHSVVLDSVISWGRLLCPRDSPGKNTQVG